MAGENSGNKVAGSPGRLEARVDGRVQGVGFRWFVQSRAGRHGLDGGVRNLGDGSVEVVAEGPMAALEALLEDLRRGPAGSHVTRVTHDFLPASGLVPGFTIWPSR